MKKFLLLIIIFFNSANASYASEDVVKIFYKVNEDIISNIDIKKEADYLKALNKNFDKINQKQIFTLAENSLIREIIKKDTIEKYYKIDYQAKQVDKFVSNLMGNLGFVSNQDFKNYLLNYNLTIQDVKKKLAIENTWNQLIYEMFHKKVKINKDELSEKIENSLKNNQYQQSFNLSEIVFTGKNKSLLEKKYNQILLDIKNLGFEQAAVLHSISETSKKGGKIGWINENQISKNIYNQIKKLSEGEYTPSINTVGGSIILKVNEKKDILADEIDKELELSNAIKIERNKQLNEFSMIYYKKIENKSYVKKF